MFSGTVFSPFKREGVSREYSINEETTGNSVWIILLNDKNDIMKFKLNTSYFQLEEDCESARDALSGLEEEEERLREDLAKMEGALREFLGRNLRDPEVVKVIELT